MSHPANAARRELIDVARRRWASDNDWPSVIDCIQYWIRTHPGKTAAWLGGEYEDYGETAWVGWELSKVDEPEEAP